MLTVIQGTKFLIWCNTRNTISKNDDEVLQFENQLKSLGGSIYYSF